jgi:hypothetical protein
MTALVTLLASVFAALFLIGPAFLSREIIGRLIIKQPSRPQTSTEEFGRLLLQSLAFFLPSTVLVLGLLRLLHHSINPYRQLDCILGDTCTHPSARLAAVHSASPVLWILLGTYLLDLLYIALVCQRHPCASVTRAS